ncbi:uncharacterized protein IUM83_03308 [Phytophthora cinnamomi]|uniref:uncharacterized protein n=1 Tax=Phytophthora cinnamomi TaxID=4785 RepID=UPI00355A1263|nr:hypothetical protein IUM83_03308 [Phytophthora cinnamomi]
MSSSRAPPLSRGNALWWSQTYGSSSASGVKPLDLDGFYRAVRDNQVGQVQRFIADHPAAVFSKVGPLSIEIKRWLRRCGAQTLAHSRACFLCSMRILLDKVFGNHQRTALYVASLFGRHQIVKLLLRRGADKDLLCDGVRAIDVAGFASADPVDRVKVRALLQGDACPQVIVRPVATGSSALDGAASETRRLEVHFSEPVDEFTQEDVVCSGGCVVTGFSMLRRDLYLVTVRLARGGGGGSVQVPAGAARAVGGRCTLSSESRPFHLGRE